MEGIQVSKRKRETEDEITFIDYTTKKSVLCDNKIFDEQQQEKEIEIPSIAKQEENRENVKEKKNSHIKELLDQERRTTLGEKIDRRTQWSKMRKSYFPRPASGGEQLKNNNNPLHAEDLDTLSKLALRLQLNKITVTEPQNTKVSEKIDNDFEKDGRIHPSRKRKHKEYDNEKYQDDKENVLTLIKTEEVQRKVREWNDKDWDEFELHNVESELPIHKEDNIREGTEAETPNIIEDKPPVIYGKVGGIRAKILIDNGAKVTVISKDFVLGNKIRRSNLTTPAKLIMANGVIEPVFHKTSNTSVVSGEFKHKINAFVAPIKNYDLILGRDNLTKLEAMIVVGQHVTVYNKQSESRIKLEFGKKDEDIDEKAWITRETLEKEIENHKGPELMIYEISITQTVKDNDSEESTVVENYSYMDKDQKIREEFQHIMKEELPAKLPPDRGLNHYIDMQGRMPKTAPRGFRLSEAENEFMEKHIRELLDKGLIQPCLGPYASPILVVKKPNSTDLRCVIDYRKVNEVTVADEYPQPIMQWYKSL